MVVDFSKVSCVSSASLRNDGACSTVRRRHSGTPWPWSPVPRGAQRPRGTGFLDFFVLNDTVQGAVADVLSRSEGRRAREHATART